MLGHLLSLATFLDPGGGPDQSGGFRVSPTAFVVILLAGFVIAVAGHVVRARSLVAFGIALIFGATVIAPVYLALAH